MSFRAKTPRPPLGDGRTSMNSFLKWVVVGEEGEGDGGGVKKEGEEIGGRAVEEKEEEVEGVKAQ